MYTTMQNRKLTTVLLIDKKSNFTVQIKIYKRLNADIKMSYLKLLYCYCREIFYVYIDLRRNTMDDFFAGNFAYSRLVLSFRRKNLFAHVRAAFATKKTLHSEDT